jgi:hypothetical protein
MTQNFQILTHCDKYNMSARALNTIKVPVIFPELSKHIRQIRQNSVIDSESFYSVVDSVGVMV